MVLFAVEIGGAAFWGGVVMICTFAVLIDKKEKR